MIYIVILNLQTPNFIPSAVWVELFSESYMSNLFKILENDV